jgi:hypothetical protein
MLFLNNVCIGLAIENNRNEESMKKNIAIILSFTATFLAGASFAQVGTNQIGNLCGSPFAPCYPQAQNQILQQQLIELQQLNRRLNVNPLAPMAGNWSNTPQPLSPGIWSNTPQPAFTPLQQPLLMPIAPIQSSNLSNCLLTPIGTRGCL